MTDAEFDNICAKLLEASHIWFNGPLHVMLEKLIEDARQARLRSGGLDAALRHVDYLQAVLKVYKNTMREYK
jgi:hypothetical protein